MVELSSMTFGYGKRPLFEDLDLKLEPGTVFGLLGLNGAGKTSLLKLLAGALRPQSGSVRVFGAEAGRREAAFLADVAFVPEDPWLPPVKPEAWLARYAVFRPAFERGKFSSLFEQFSLERDKALSTYSYGQRKKFALAAALASGARLLLLDEPTNGLDIPSKSQFRRVLAESIGPDRVVVVSTHQVRDLERVIDPALIVHGGKMLFRLGAEQVADRLASVHLRELGPGVVYAERDSVGYSALVGLSSGAEKGLELGNPDLELVFNAAIAMPSRLEAALRREGLPPFEPDQTLVRPVQEKEESR